MISQWIDVKYITDTYGFEEFGDAKQQNYYIGRACRKVAQLITHPLFDESDLSPLSVKQQNAIKEAACLYTDYYYKLDYDFTEGAISVSIGSQAFSETRTYQGEKYIPQVYDLLANADLMETDYGSIISVDVDYSGDEDAITTPTPTGIDDNELLKAEAKYG